MRKLLLPLALLLVLISCQTPPPSEDVIKITTANTFKKMAHSSFFADDVKSVDQVNILYVGKPSFAELEAPGKKIKYWPVEVDMSFTTVSSFFGRKTKPVQKKGKGRFFIWKNSYDEWVATADLKSGG